MPVPAVCDPQVVLFLVTSPHFRSAAVTPSLIADLSAYLTASSSSGASATSATSMAEFKEHMMHVVESICQVSNACTGFAPDRCYGHHNMIILMPCCLQQAELVLQHYQAMADHLLPALCTVVRTPAESGDMRFFCLRMVSEVTQQFLLDPELYGVPTSESDEARAGIATSTIDALMTGHVLPMVPQLLRDEDPMPLYGLKVCRI